MNTKTVYSRKISRTEAQKDFIFVLKKDLSFFPSQGNNFKLLNDNLCKEIKVESYPCTCRGPDFPHEHYFIRWEGLKAGYTIKIVKTPETADKYYLRVDD